MGERLARRTFLAGAGATIAGATYLLGATSAEGEATGTGSSFSGVLADLHAHLDNSSIDDVVALARQRGVKLGIVEHAGTKENKYPVILGNDEELGAYLAMLDGKPVYKGVQAEWADWKSCFSAGMLARLDYVLSDAMTWPGPDGKRAKMWESEACLGDRATFMDRYVDWYVQVMNTQPLDIMANVSWLPGPFAADYDALWTEARVAKVIDAALRNGIALEISTGFKLPKLLFLKQAKAAGVKFSFGTNGRYPKMGLLDYSLEMARALGLQDSDLFTPAVDGLKAVQHRRG